MNTFIFWFAVIASGLLAWIPPFLMIRQTLSLGSAECPDMATHTRRVLSLAAATFVGLSMHTILDMSAEALIGRPAGFSWLSTVALFATLVVGFSVAWWRVMKKRKAEGWAQLRSGRQPQSPPWS